MAKGWNTKRRPAQPGRADTLVTDARARAVYFAAGEPAGLSVTMPGVLAQLREVTGPDAAVEAEQDRRVRAGDLGGPAASVRRTVRDLPVGDPLPMITADLSGSPA